MRKVLASGTNIKDRTLVIKSNNIFIHYLKSQIYAENHDTQNIKIVCEESTRVIDVSICLRLQYDFLLVLAQAM